MHYVATKICRTSEIGLNGNLFWRHHEMTFGDGKLSHANQAVHLTDRKSVV